LLHYLLFDPVMGKSGKLDAVIQAVASGTPSTDAMRQAYGDFEPLEGAYMLHVRKELMPYSRLKTETKVTVSSFASRALSEADAANTRAALHAVMGRPGEAKALIAEARKNGDAAAGYEVEAMLAERDGNAAAHKAALARPSSSGPRTSTRCTDWRCWRCRRTMTPRRTQSPRRGCGRPSSSTRCIRRRTRRWPACSHRGRRRSAPRPFRLRRKRSRSRPRDWFTRSALARSLWNVGERDAALAQARLAVSLAQTDAQRGQAQQLLDFFVKNAASAPR
jgi:hypothetical protein